MELTFEEVLTFDNKELLQFGHEPDDLFIGYYLKDRRLENQSSDPYMGDFSNLDWQTREARRITASPVSNFGIKTFPQFGAYGFYTPLYGDGTSRVVAPINPKRGLKAEPTLELAQDETTVTVKITDSRNISYKCYRIMFRDGHFAYEFITYDKELVIDKEDLPPGTYITTLIGFIPEQGIASHETRTLATPLEVPYGMPEGAMSVVSWSNDGEYLAIGFPQETANDAGFMWLKRVDDTFTKLNLPSDFPKVSINRLAWSEDNTTLMLNDDSSDEQYKFTVNTNDTLTKTTSGTGLLSYTSNVSWSPNEEYLAVGFPTLLLYKTNPNIDFVVT